MLPKYQNVLNLIVRISTRRSPSALFNVVMWEHCTGDNCIFEHAKFTTLTPLSSAIMYEYIAAYLLKARIVEPEETFIAREQHDNSTRLGTFYAVRATFPQQQRCKNNSGPNGSNSSFRQRRCYRRSTTVRVQLQRKFLVVSFEGLVPRRTDWR
jgi:hypothetical protein